jgi:hypothetical protein
VIDRLLAAGSILLLLTSVFQILSRSVQYSVWQAAASLLLLFFL